MAIGTSQAFRTQNFRLLGNFYDKDNWVGKKGYALSSDENGVHWEADQNETSGIFSGGIMTATIGGTTFNVSAGVGQVVSRTLDIPTGEVKTNTTRVSWNTQSNIALTYRTTHPFSYIYIDENGAVQQQNSSFTDAEYKNKIILGTICHIDLATINLVTNKQNITYGDSHRLYELISTFGPIKRNGLAVSAYTTNLRLKRESGVAFLIGSNYTTDQFEPDSISLNSANPASLCRVYKNGTGGFVFDTNGGSFYTDVDPNKYDNGSGTLQTVNNNQWTIQRLFFFPNNPNDIIAYYGVGIYNSYGDAVTAMATESFSEATITAENAVFLAYLVVRGGALDLSLVSDGKFFQSGAFRNIGAIGGGGGGAGAIILDDLTDVAITTPLDGQFLAYDGGASLWKNSTLNAVNPLVFSGIGTSLTLSLNYATASQPGGVSTSAQTFGGVKTFASNVIVSGNLTVNGSTTTIDAQTLVVKDKNIELGVVASPTDLTADGGGITLKGTTDKTFNWIDATDSWTSSENLDLASGKSYKINGADVLTSTTLGSGVINSSLQSVGALNNLTVAGYAYLATTSGNVGVGTVTTNAKLDILQSSTSNNQLRIYSNDATPQLRTYTTSDGYGLIINQYYAVGGSPYLRSADFVASTGDVSSTMMRFFTKPYSSNPVERVRITSDGIVGIGAVNPSNSKLHIYADHISGHSVLKIQTITAIAGGGVPSLGFFDSDGSRNTLLYAASDGTYLANEVTKPIFFSTNSTIKMTVTSTGNVGIGTTTPNQFLEVRRTTGSAIALLNYNDTVKLNINASSGGAGYVGMVSNHPLILVTNDTEKVKIGTNGNVCIGNADANNKLSVLGSASVGSNYNVAAPTNGLIVEGDMGVGITTPTSQANYRFLQVNGTNSAVIETMVGGARIGGFDSSSSVLYVGTIGAFPLVFRTEVTERWRITNAGILQSNGAQTIQTSTGTLTLATAAGNGHIVLTPNGTGNVGVNTTNPATRLEVADSNVATDSIGNLFVRTTNNQGINIGGQISLGGYYSASNIYTFGSIAGRKENATSGNVAGYLALSTTTSGGTNTERVRINSDGNVGINVTSPLAKLHTVGQVYIDNYTSLTAKNILTLNMNGANYAHIYDTGLAGNVIAIGGAANISTVPSSSIMSWDLDDARVGIGTNTPTAKLDVNGGAVFANGLTVSTDASSTSYFIGANGTRPIIFQNNTAASYDFGFKFTDSNTFTLVGGNTLANPTTDLVSFKFDGNVGIGTTAPTGGLHINNAPGTFSEVLRLQRNGGVFYSVGLDTNFLNIAYNGNTNASNIFVLKTNGFLGLGNLQTANYNLDIASTQGQGIQLRFDTTTNYLARITPYWNSNTDSRIDFAINRSGGVTPDVIMSVGYGGNVGIGTTAPSKTLDVKGAGGVLNLQSTSNDVWQTFAPQTGNVWRLQAQTGNTFGIYDEAASAFRLLINSNGNVGVGSASANNKLHVNGSASIGSNYNIAAPTNGLIVEGNVGIGTSTVSTKLHVSGGTYISNIVGTGDLRIENIDTVGVGISLKNHTGKYWFMYNGGSSSWAGDGVLGFVYTDGVNAATGPKVVFKSDGNVGIGTNNPNATLQIAGTSTGILTVGTLTNNWGGVVAIGVTNGNGVILSKVNTSNDTNRVLVLMRDDTNGAKIEGYTSGGASTDVGFLIRAGASSYFNGGNVGIGTSSPAGLLDVRAATAGGKIILGTYDYNYHIRIESGDQLNFYNGASPNPGYINYGGGATVLSQNLHVEKATGGTTGLVRIKSDGNVGIGTNSPSSKLHVSNLAAATRITITDDVANGRSGYIESNYSDALVIGTTSGVRSIKFAPDNSTAMTIAVGTNNVGIGTTAPTNTIDINGTARVRSISASASTATIFLTTDANGVLISRTAAQVRSDIGAGTGSGTVTSVTGTAPIASSGGTTPAISLNDSGVTYAKIQNVSATARVLGRITAGAGVVEELTGANIATIIDTNAVTNSTNAANVTIATDDTTNSSYYLYFGANASGNTPLKASTKIRYNPSIGAFSATTKSFRIPHPTKPEHDLVYGSLESPYHGIRLTGKGKTNGVYAEINLPDYIKHLVDENTVNIQITSIKCAKVFYIENIDIQDNKFIVKYDKSWYQKANNIEFFWDFTAERKDVPKLDVEEKL